MELSKKAHELIREQIANWDLAAKNYGSLSKVKVKSFNFGNYHIDVQFNPERIVSSSAKIDVQSIEARPCFLCLRNLPVQQRRLDFNNEYMILVNPFPIFPEHLTIPNLSHKDQRILGNFESMLDLAGALDDFTVFYNGPKCGASAPDHLHFQAGIKGFLPIEKDFKNKVCCEKVREIKNVKISHWPDYRRGVITLNSNDKNDLIECFNQVYNQLQKNQPGEEEPMLNILAGYDPEGWVVHLFPRIVHRPAEYFETGEKQILLSPASVDMGGVFITPRESDFVKISLKDVQSILKQVCMDSISVIELINKL